MTDPAIHSLTKDTWVKVATAVYGATIYPSTYSPDSTSGKPPKYYITYIDTGTTTLDAAKNAVQIPLTEKGVLVALDYQVDVYCIARDADGNVWVGV